MQIMLDDVSNDHDMTHRIARRLLREPEAECVGVLDVALICAVQYRKNLETVLLLLDHGAGVSELSTTTGGTAFHYAIYHYVEHLRRTRPTPEWCGAPPPPSLVCWLSAAFHSI